MAEYETSVAPLKRRLFGELLGERLPPGTSAEQPAQLLELGIGTGPNLPYYAGFYGLSDGTSDSSSGGGATSSSEASSSSSQVPARPAGRSLPPLHVTGVDPNPFMRPYLEESAAAAGWPLERLSWVAGTAEALPLADASMDAVVCTLVGAVPYSALQQAAADHGA
jgi:hypothetical protein